MLIISPHSDNLHHTLSAMTTGKVFIVGAGPGDLRLATIRAKELISSADVVVYDDLMHPDLLSWCRSDCERICVGRRARRHALLQDEVGSILVARAKAGLRVVRLKGGDPFVFGRGGDEAHRLAADGIAFEVVPGVTAALAAAACAGIPLIQCNTNSALVVLNGDEDPETHALKTDWRRYGGLPDATLAIYMGIENLRRIMAGLMAGGMAPATPAAAVQWASLGRQRSVVGTAATLADLAEARKLGAPAVILVGEVVRGHEAIGWFERLPLFGRRVVVTRARAQAGELCEKLEALGAEVLVLLLVDIKPHVDRDMTLEIFAEVGRYDWIVFTSGNGVRHFFDLFLKAFRDLRALGVMRIACVGEATAQPVRALHLEVEISPEAGTSDALADALIDTGSLENAKVLVITGNLNRDALVIKLEAAGAIVDTFKVYENVRPDPAGDPAAEEFRLGGADAVLFASSSAVHAFAAQAAALKLADGARRPLAGSIGPRTSEAIRKAGIRVDFEAKESTMDSLVGALVEKLGPASPDR
jgi:uroporphyrinogen III methyltransferase/synthase